MRPLIAEAIAAAQADPRVVGLAAGGSVVNGTVDEFSDLDLFVVCRDDDHPSIVHDAPVFAARLGQLLSSFTGEHVREPRLLVCLFGPPPRQVDLLFVAERDFDQRREDGRMLWQRDRALDAALHRVPAVRPSAELQWIEDRFWTWIFSAAAKVGRGEFFHCLEMLAFLRRTVFGPLIAQRHGAHPNGVRRMEQVAPDLVPAMAATIGDHSALGCLSALHAAVDLYRQLRGESPDLVRHAAAEAASVGYLAEMETRLMSTDG
jgi:hypothetical protein